MAHAEWDFSQWADARCAGYLSITTVTVLNVVEVCDGSKWLVQLLHSDHPTMVNEGLLAISVVCSHVRVGGGVGAEKLQGTSVVKDVLGLLSGVEESASQEMLCNALALILHLCQQGEWEGGRRHGCGRENGLKDDDRKKGR